MIASRPRTRWAWLGAAFALCALLPALAQAPLRIYVTETPGGRATLTYREPSAVFAPYASPALDAVAKELDVVFRNIVRDAAGG